MLRERGPRPASGVRATIRSMRAGLTCGMSVGTTIMPASGRQCCRGTTHRCGKSEITILVNNLHSRCARDGGRLGVMRDNQTPSQLAGELHRVKHIVEHEPGELSAFDNVQEWRHPLFRRSERFDRNDGMDAVSTHLTSYETTPASTPPASALPARNRAAKVRTVSASRRRSSSVFIRIAEDSTIRG